MNDIMCPKCNLNKSKLQCTCDFPLDLCIDCEKRPIKYRISQLCNACYTKRWRKGEEIRKPPYEKFKKNLEKKVKVLESKNRNIYI